MEAFMRLRSLLFAAALAAASLSAGASPQQRTVTDMWFNPAESGWGLNLIHQGDTLFGSLFVYGPDGQPKWYTASSLVGGDTGTLHDQPAVYTGALFESAGPWFGAGSFDPSTVTRRDVGTLSVEIGTTGLATIDFTVDGVHVVKQARPFSFKASSLTSIAYGYEFQPAGADGTPEVARDLQIFLTDNGTTVTGSSDSNSEGVCNYSGTRGQEGQYQTVSGTFNCGNGARTGPWFMRVDPTPDGYVGSFQGNGVGTFWGRIAASKRGDPSPDGNGWRNGMWFPPNESGWGVNIIEQGDTIFASLFVYDAQRRPHWYTGSALTRSGTGEGAVFSGPLYETTGPYFGGSFDPSAVTHREVGTMSFQQLSDNQAFLGYTADGVAVSKTVNRFIFRKNDLTGSYLGHTVANNADAPAGLTYNAVFIDINDGDAGFSMSMRPAPTASNVETCNFNGPPALQVGEYRSVAGTYTCSGGGSGTFSMENLFAAFDGFTGSFTGRGVIGHIEGVRRNRN
jgi:hypothetical protein